MNSSRSVGVNEGKMLIARRGGGGGGGLTFWARDDRRLYSLEFYFPPPRDFGFYESAPAATLACIPSLESFYSRVITFYCS